MNPKIGEVAHLGGQAKAAGREGHLRARVEELPALTDLETAQVWLRAVAELAASGVLSGSQAGAAARAIEIWVRAEQARVDRNRFRDLERQVEGLEQQLAVARRSAEVNHAR